MESIAIRCAAKGSVELAVHILLILEEACRVTDSSRASKAVCLAVRIVKPVLSHDAHQASPSASTENLLNTAKRLSHRIQHQAHGMESEVVESFEFLRSIVEFHTFVLQRNEEGALRIFYSLRFIPKSSEPREMDRAVEDFNLKVAEEVQATVPKVVAAFANIQLASFQHTADQAKRRVIQGSIVILKQWSERWHSKLGREQMTQLLNTTENHLRY